MQSGVAIAEPGFHLGQSGGIGRVGMELNVKIILESHSHCRGFVGGGAILESKPTKGDIRRGLTTNPRDEGSDA